ncbi:alpha/beta hydrolase [uncultured Kiloniella sp.]|uniref:alpha/beta fold hydrolase n=1 Tax=uncultured Kiloniella sp. TaxID=1133091 RepID=UPI0026303C3E|nr:alpha/beta hydrolase [uncultured Kiloniella sp.]
MNTLLESTNIESWQQQTSFGHAIQGFHRQVENPEQRVHFLHGTGFSAGTLIPLMHLMPESWDCYISNIPGHGGSTWNEDRAPNWLEMADALAESIRKKMDVENKGPVVGIGHSFGGMMSQEIAAIMPIRKVLIISSIKSRKELPPHFSIIKKLGIQHVMSKSVTLASLPLWGKYHDYVSKEEQTLFKDMVDRHSSSDLRWALTQLSGWQTPPMREGTELVHIHGEGDRTFPIKRIQQPVHVIKGGGHFMVYKQAELVGDLIKSSLPGD